MICATIPESVAQTLEISDFFVRLRVQPALWRTESSTAEVLHTSVSSQLDECSAHEARPRPLR